MINWQTLQELLLEVNRNIFEYFLGRLHCINRSQDTLLFVEPVIIIIISKAKEPSLTIKNRTIFGYIWFDLSTTTPRVVITKPRDVITTPRDVITTPRDFTTTPRDVIIDN